MMPTLREKHVVILSGACGVLNLILVIILGIAWAYWSDTLNNLCLDSTCSCIFYAQLRGNNFTGGHSLWCKAITYSALVLSITSFFVAGYYFSRNREASEHSKHFSGRVSQNYDDEAPPHQRRRSHFSFTFKVFCGIFALITFAHACMLTEGYSSSCREYKPMIRRQLSASGDMSDMINNRLSCGATFDFLDYIQTETTQRYPGQYSQYYNPRRTFRLDTGTLLFTCILISWFNVAMWIFLASFTLFWSPTTHQHVFDVVSFRPPHL